MKRKTTFVAVMSQTFTTTSTSRTVAKSYTRNDGAYDLANPDGETLATVTTPLANLAQRWCVECDTPIAMMSPEVAATFCLHSTREIYRLVEAGRVHFTDGPGGVFVCPASLMKDWAGDQSFKLLASAPWLSAEQDK